MYRHKKGPAVVSSLHPGQDELSGQRVLVVEDDFDIAEAMVAAVISAGAQVVGPSSTAAHAFRLMREFEPTLAVLDASKSLRDRLQVIDGGVKG